MIYGIGFDLVQVSRMEAALRRWQERFHHKVFTPEETRYCLRKKNPFPNFAARFAAKEAFLKAMGTGWSGGHKFSEIEVINNALGKPELFVHGKVKEFCEAHGIAGMELSLTHIKDVASAVVVLEKKTP